MTNPHALLLTRWRAALALLVVVTLLSLGGPFASADFSRQQAPLDPGLVATAQAQGAVRVIVTLDGSYTPDGLLSAAAASRQQERIFERQARVERAIAAQNATVLHRFTYVPQMVLEVDAAALQALQSTAGVAAIEEDRLNALHLSSSVPVINGDDVRALGYTGAGWAVAVLDTGVQNNHPWFGSRVIAEACFNTTSTSNNSFTRCPNGQENMTGAGAAADDCPECGHGTHVAGIAAGRDPNGTHIGVAPDANIIGVNVFSYFPGNIGSNRVLAYNSDIYQGLEYVYGLRNTYQIAAVNMSLGGGSFTSACDNDGTKPYIDNLRAAGIATVISSGNSGSSTGIGAPGCVSTAITVSSTMDNDTVSSFSNVNAVVDVYAPGHFITSATPGSTTGSKSGTSMAAPHVAGAWAVLKQADNAANVTTIENVLETTGVPINARGYVLPRIDLLAALNQIAPLTAPTISSVTNIQRTSAQVTWNDPNNSEDEYRAYLNGNFVGTFAANTTTGALNGLTCGTNYSVQISVKQGANELWSTPVNITTAICEDLQTVRLTSPQNAIPNATSVNLTFNTQAGTTKHFILLTNPNNTTVGSTINTANCAGGTCTVNFDGFQGVPGTYKIQIQPFSQDFAGPLSSGDTFEMLGTANALTLLSPRGEVRPSVALKLAWEAQEGMTAATVNVYGPNGYFSQATVDTTGCAGGVCYTYIPNVMAEGGYQVWMQPLFGNIGGPWAPSDFTVRIGDLLPVVLESPRETVTLGDEATTLQWRAQPGVIGFMMSLYAPDGSIPINNQWVDLKGCSTGTDLCTLTVPTSSTGNYAAAIMPLTGYQFGPWNATNFTVAEIGVAPVNIISPNISAIPTTRLPVIFEAAAGVDSVRVDVYEQVAGLVFSNTINMNTCNGNTCIVEVNHNFTPGNYAVVTQAQAGATFSDWTSVPFTVTGSLQPVSLSAPTGTVLPNDAILLTFATQPGTTAHKVLLTDGVSTLFNDIVNTTDCAGATCELLVPSQARTGTYTATLQPYAGDTAGPTNNSQFTVADGARNAVTLVRPVGTIPATNPLTLQFNAQAGTDAHNINVYAPDGTLLRQGLVDTSGCSGTLCTVEVPGGTLAGNYSVWMQASANGFGGPWAESTFTVSGDMTPVVLTSPTGQYTPAGSTIPLSFNAQQGVTLHQIDVYNNGRLLFRDNADTATCAGGSCTVFMPYVGYTGTYSVWIQPKAGLVGGPWNGSSFNVVTTPPAEAVAASDVVNVTSVCAGTWELGNPLDETLSGEWLAYNAVGDLQTGTFTLEPNSTTPLQTAPGTTGLTLEFDGGDSLYTEAALVACE